MNNIEAVVLLAKEFGWSRKDIGKLTLVQLNAIVEELAYQKRLEDYAESYRFAFLACVICNLLGQGQTPEEMVGQIPRREDNLDEERLLALARQTRRKGGKD